MRNKEYKDLDINSIIQKHNSELCDDHLHTLCAKGAEQITMWHPRAQKKMISQNEHRITAAPRHTTSMFKRDCPRAPTFGAVIRHELARLGTEEHKLVSVYTNIWNLSDDVTMTS